MLRIIDSERIRRPLDRVELTAGDGARITVHDGKGRPYARLQGGGSITVSGHPGWHRVVLAATSGAEEESVGFQVQAVTAIDDRGGRFKRLLYMLYRTMSTELDSAHFAGKSYRFYVRWLRDHVHTLKGMKWFDGGLTSAIDLYADTQREDGMIFDNVYPRDPAPNMWDQRFEALGFIRHYENDTVEMKRIPVENDVEYLFIEGVYWTWKATGDGAWMRDRLDQALKALHYARTDRCRWSAKHQLLKRGFTIDTWDFQPSEDAALAGGDAMRIDPDRTRFGIMHGDNTGMASACGYLAEMLDSVDRRQEASVVREFGSGLRTRLDALAWNGRFFTHHVPEDPAVVRDLGVDQAGQISLSNAYATNRGIRHEQAVAIIDSYQELKSRLPPGSPGEWFQIHPPFTKGFGGHNGLWQYMNGGVTTIVAGELAHGAFEHGREAYGSDILVRLHDLGERFGGAYHECYRGAMPLAPVRSFRTLDLRALVNADFRGDAPSGRLGWTDEGDNDLRNMPVGRQAFHDIELEVIDPGRNDRRACLALSSKPGFLPHVSIAIGGKAASFYLLHTMGGGPIAGVLSLQYTDGTQHRQYVRSGEHIGGWWMPQEPRANRSHDQRLKVAWHGPNPRCRNVGVYLWGLDNPHPDREVASINLEAAIDGTRWMVLGITTCDAPVFFKPYGLSFGIPTNWGAAAVVYALMEGLAGIKDAGTAFDASSVSPRWASAGIDEVSACGTYPASGGYAAYRYRCLSDRIHLDLAGSGQTSDVAVLLPVGRHVASVQVDGQGVAFSEEPVEQSAYLRLSITGIEAHVVEIRLTPG